MKIKIPKKLDPVFTVEVEGYSQGDDVAEFESAVKSALNDINVNYFHIDFDELDNGEPFATVSH